MSWSPVATVELEDGLVYHCAADGQTRSGMQVDSDTRLAIPGILR
jgi:hypothetical protein